MTTTGRKGLLLAAAIVAGGLGYLAWKHFQPAKLPEGFASSNGRIEATEIDVATKLAGRVINELGNEGDYVTAGQVVAYMQVDVLEAQLREANAKLREAESAVVSAQSTVQQRQSDKGAALAVVKQREAELGLANRNLQRAEGLLGSGAMSKEEIDTRRASVYSAQATLESAKANVAAADAAIATAKSQAVNADHTGEASKATIERVQADINDSTLKAPRDGRVQYRIAQPGEVLPAGGKVLNMVDLGDVYMTFFLPTEWAGRVQMGAETRIILTAAAQFVIRADVRDPGPRNLRRRRPPVHSQDARDGPGTAKAHVPDQGAHPTRAAQEVRPQSQHRAAGCRLRAT